MCLRLDENSLMRSMVCTVLGQGPLTGRVDLYTQECISLQQRPGGALSNAVCQSGLQEMRDQVLLLVTSERRVVRDPQNVTLGIWSSRGWLMHVISGRETAVRLPAVNQTGASHSQQLASTLL